MHQQARSLEPAPSRIWLIPIFVVVFLVGARLNAIAYESLPSTTPDFATAIQPHFDQLAQVESDKDAIALFVSTIGPSLQLGDAAKALGANALPVKVAKELLMPELTAATYRFIGNLAAWQLATTIRQAVKDQQFSAVTAQLSKIATPLAWLGQQRSASWYNSLTQLIDAAAAPEWATGNLVVVVERTARLETDALQASYQEWDRIRSWKDQVRGIRGQSRLCGTWQWIIHNHQKHHQEQKLALRFPPVGAGESTPGLVETIVLGDNVYLRWEINGHVQEDSLQFSKEGKRLEGTFVNSQGSWGSISGKRSAGCAP
ncbi:MAG: hypothetical protein JW388_0241 [Nitrospira sp.]|nr:hypothetical protein [Nitrospira sp.]